MNQGPNTPPPPPPQPPQGPGYPPQPPQGQPPYGPGQPPAGPGGQPPYGPGGNPPYGSGGQGYGPGNPGGLPGPGWYGQGPKPGMRDRIRGKEKTIGIAAAAIMVVLALVISALVLIPRMLGGNSDAENLYAVNDVDGEAGWNDPYVYAVDDGYTLSWPITHRMVDDEALIVTGYADYGDHFDSLASNWYSGIEQDYELGWENYDEWQETDPGPFENTPSEYQPWNQEDVTEEWGYQDGWYDNAYGYSYGDNLPDEPDIPDTETRAALLNLNSGDTEWMIVLEDVLEGFDATVHFHNGITITHVEEAGTVIIRWIRETGDDGYEYVFTSLDTGNGEVRSETSFDAPVSAVVRGSDVIFTPDFGYGGDRLPAMEARSASDLESEQWSSELEVESVVDVQIIEDTPSGDILRIDGAEREGDDTDTFFLYLENGSEVESLDLRSDASYEMVAGELIERRLVNDEAEVVAIDESGSLAWGRAERADVVWIVNDLILTARESGSSYDSLQLLDPSDGEPLWESDLRESFSQVLPASDENFIYLEDGDTLISVDTGSGEVVFSEDYSGLASVHPGGDYLYVITDENLYGLDWETGRDEMSYRAGEDQLLRQVGRHILVIDTDSLELTVLE